MPVLALIASFLTATSPATYWAQCGDDADAECDAATEDDGDLCVLGIDCPEDD